MAELLACAQCGQTNSSERFWCKRCRADVSRLPDSPIHKLETDLTSSTQLYEQVLVDLNTLRRRAAPDQPVPELIERFYTARLKTIRALLQCVGRIRAWGSLGRATMHELEETHRTLLQAERLWPEEKFLRRIGSDIGEELARRGELLCEERALALLTSAVSCQDPDEAERHIAEAYAVAPGNTRVQARGSELQQLISRRREHVRSPGPDRPGPATREPPATSPAASGRTTPVEAEVLPPLASSPAVATARPIARDRVTASFDEEETATPSATQRWLEIASDWSSVLKPFLVDNVGWFIGTFLIVAGFVVLLAAFWRDIGANPVLLRSLVFWLLAATTSAFFGLAYYIRRKHPQLETSSNVLLIIVALLIPLVFAAAAVTTLVPAATQIESPAATATAGTS